MTTTTSASEPISGRRLNAIGLVLVLGALTTLLDTTIVNIALDHLRSVFHSSVTDTQWVATAYLLAFVSAIPVSGWLSERLGARNAWMLAVAAFALGSLLCGLAWSLPSLIVFRVLQGLGGGLVLPVTITILTRAAGKERIGRAIGTIGLMAQLAPILGPIIGGSILESISWHWLFFVNLPICVTALVLARIFLPSTSAQRGHRFDAVGFLLLTPGIALIAYGVSRLGTQDGSVATAAGLPIAAGVALALGFTAFALRTRSTPLIDVRVFARRSFGLSSVITFVGGFSMYAVMFLLPLFYQQIRGESVLTTGLLLIPQGLGTMLFILLSRKLLAGVDGRAVVAGGVVLLMLGLVPFLVVGAGGGTPLLLIAQLVQGIGMGAVSLPLMTMAFAGLAPAEMPRGSAAFSIVQRVGAPFGVTVIAVILQHALTGATTTAAALTAFHTTFWWVFGLSAIPLALAFFIPTNRLTRPTPATA